MKTLKWNLTFYFSPTKQQNGYILENSKHILENFSNLQDIINILIEKLTIGTNEFLQDYLFDNYFLLIINNSSEVYYDLIDVIYDGLGYKNKPVWYNTVKK